MKYSTIQVTPRLRRRLARYKLPGMSYEQVLERLADAIPPEDFRARHEVAQVAAKSAFASGAPGSGEAATRAGRRHEDERLARATPGQRMEEAYRVFALLRGSS